MSINRLVKIINFIFRVSTLKRTLTVAKKKSLKRFLALC